MPNRKAVIETFLRVAEHLESGGSFAVHIADASRFARPLTQQATTHVVVQYDLAGNKLRLDILERNFEPSPGNFSQIPRYSMIRPDGAVGRVSSERLTYRAIQKAELEDAAARAWFMFRRFQPSRWRNGKFCNIPQGRCVVIGLKLFGQNQHASRKGEPESQSGYVRIDGRVIDKLAEWDLAEQEAGRG